MAKQPTNNSLRNEHWMQQCMKFPHLDLACFSGTHRRLAAQMKRVNETFKSEMISITCGVLPSFCTRTRGLSSNAESVLDCCHDDLRWGSWCCLCASAAGFFTKLFASAALLEIIIIVAKQEEVDIIDGKRGAVTIMTTIFKSHSFL